MMVVTISEIAYFAYYKISESITGIEQKCKDTYNSDDHIAQSMFTTSFESFVQGQLNVSYKGILRSIKMSNNSASLELISQKDEVFPITVPISNLSVKNANNQLKTINDVKKGDLVIMNISLDLKEKNPRVEIII